MYSIGQETPTCCTNHIQYGFDLEVEYNSRPGAHRLQIVPQDGLETLDCLQGPSVGIPPYCGLSSACPEFCKQTLVCFILLFAEIDNHPVGG